MGTEVAPTPASPRHQARLAGDAPAGQRVRVTPGSQSESEGTRRGDSAGSGDRVVRRLTPAQYQAELRRQQREVDAYNRRVQQHNAKVTSEINAHNRKVADHNRTVVAAAKEQQRAVDKYNRQVTVHNQRVRANQQRLSREIAHLQASTRGRATIQPYETSVTTLRSSFSRLDAAAEGGLTVQDDLFDLSEGETANSVAALNALNAKPSPDEPTDAEVAELQETTITSEHVAPTATCTHGGSERSSLFILATPTPHATSAPAHASSSHGCSRPPPPIATSSEMTPSASELSRARSPVGLGFVTASVEVEGTASVSRSLWRRTSRT